MRLLDVQTIDPVADYRNTLFKKVHMETNCYGLALDIGCGNGEDAVLLSKYADRVFALDIQENVNWFKLKREKYRLVFNIADARNLPFRDNQFDFIFIKDVLHHAVNFNKIISEIKRVVKPGGTIMIIEANRFNPIFYLHMTLMHGHQHFSRGFFIKLIKRHFKKAEIRHIETRVYPVCNACIIYFLHLIESILEKISVFRPFLAYNVAIIKNYSKV